MNLLLILVILKQKEKRKTDTKINGGVCRITNSLLLLQVERIQRVIPYYTKLFYLIHIKYAHDSITTTHSYIATIAAAQRLSENTDVFQSPILGHFYVHTIKVHSEINITNETVYIATKRSFLCCFYFLTLSNSASKSPKHMGLKQFHHTTN